MKRVYYVAVAAVFLVFGIQVLPAQAATTGKPYGPGVNLIGSVNPEFTKDEGSPSASLGGRLLFAGSDARGGGKELWSTDGTAAGTRLVKDINLGPESSGPGNFLRLGNRVLFTAYTSSGTEWWTTDGTTAGTKQLLDINPGAGSSSPGAGVVVGKRMFFAANTPETGRELWVTDGTPGGTRIVKDVAPENLGSGPYNLTAFGSKVVYTAYVAGLAKAFVSDGTAVGTGRLDVTAGDQELSPQSYTVLGNRVLFTASDGEAGNELWSSGGTMGDARRLKDLRPGSSSSGPRSLTRLGDVVVFAAYDANQGRELWASDGTAGGTVLIRDLYAGTSSGDPAYFVRVGARLFFSAEDANQNYELWTTGGSAQTTRKVAELTPGNAGSFPYPLATVGDRLLFGATDADRGYEPWVSDGSAAGTRPLGDLWAGVNGSTPEAIGVLGGTALFEVTTTGDVDRLAAYTLPVPRLKAAPKRSYSRKDAARKKIRIKVAVAATGVVPTGRVALYKGSKRVGSATLSHGTAKVRITSKLRRGKHTLVIRYGGSLWAQSNSSVPFRIRVR